MVLVATLAPGRPGESPPETAVLVERLHALLDEVRYAAYFAPGGCEVRADGEWPAFVAKMAAALAEADPALHAFVEGCARATAVGQARPRPPRPRPPRPRAVPPRRGPR